MKIDDCFEALMGNGKFKKDVRYTPFGKITTYKCVKILDDDECDCDKCTTADTTYYNTNYKPTDNRVANLNKRISELETKIKYLEKELCLLKARTVDDTDADEDEVDDDFDVKNEIYKTWVDEFCKKLDKEDMPPGQVEYIKSVLLDDKE